MTCFPRLPFSLPEPVSNQGCLVHLVPSSVDREPPTFKPEGGGLVFQDLDLVAVFPLEQCVSLLGTLARQINAGGPSFA